MGAIFILWIKSNVTQSLNFAAARNPQVETKKYTLNISRISREKSKSVSEIVNTKRILRFYTIFKRYKTMNNTELKELCEKINTTTQYNDCFVIGDKIFSSMFGEIHITKKEKVTA